MVAASELHVVLGAAGGTGSAVVRELAACGLRVRAVTRGGVTEVPEGVERVAADVGTSVGARRACEGAAVVYHCAQPDYRKWRELFPAMTRAVLDGASAAGAKLVFADNLYMYGPPEDRMTEETRQRAQGKKGRTRIEMADAILGAHADGRLRCTIGRSSDYYGPRGTGSTAGDNVMKPALRADDQDRGSVEPLSEGAERDALPVRATLRLGRVEVPGRVRPIRADAASGGREAHGGLVPAPVRRRR